MKKFKIEIILMGVLAMIFASCSDFFAVSYTHLRAHET